MHTLRRIVVGIDFSAGADRALDAAVNLARAAQAGVTIAHVGDPDDDLEDPRLARAVACVVARHPDLDVTSVLRRGKPWDKLNNVAIEVGAGLIVIGRGRGELGSVADRLVRCASRPILVVGRDGP